LELDDDSFEMMIDEWNDKPSDLVAGEFGGRENDRGEDREEDEEEEEEEEQESALFSKISQSSSNESLPDPNTRVKNSKKSKAEPKKSVIRDTWKKKYLKHYEVVEGDTKVACRTCSARIEPITLLLARHLMRSHGLARKDGAIQPLFCDRGHCNGSVVFISYEEYIRHLRTYHAEKKSVKPKKKMEMDDKVETVCFLCGNMVKNLKLHMKKTHEDPGLVACPHPGCEKRFAKVHMKHHMRCHEPGVCPYPDCHMQFRTKNFLTTHIRNVHKSHLIQKWPCPQCSYVAKREVHLNRHVREIHTVGRVYSCPEFGCNLTFKRASTLEQHARIHLNIKPYQCRWCEFTGAQQNNIRSHASTAHREEYLAARHHQEKYWRRSESPSMPDLSIPPSMQIQSGSIVTPS